MRFASLCILIALASCWSPSDDGRALRVSVSTTSKAAAEHFRSGLLLYYAYNPSAAFREFRASVRADRHFAMAWWGLAISKTGNINVGTTPERIDLARRAIRKARSLEPYANAEEHALIDALAKRLSGSGEKERVDEYASAMREVAKRYPLDSDIQTLYGSALLEAAAGLGESAPEHPELSKARFRVAFHVLQVAFRTSQNVGAAHFLIHAAELTDNASAARDAADYLARIPLPSAASHLTHMAAHVYLHQHDWNAMSDAAQRALEMDRIEQRDGHRTEYDSNRFYYVHNLNFLLYALIQRDRLKTAVTVARSSQNAEVVSEALLAAGLYEQLASEPATFESVPSLFGHSVAAARRHDFAGATEFERLLDRAIARVKALDPHAVQNISNSLIDGEVALNNGQPAKACSKFRLARSADSLRAGDLPLFYYYPLQKRLNECRKTLRNGS